MKKSTNGPMTNSSPHRANTIAQRTGSKASIIVNDFCGSGTRLSLRTSEPEASRLRISEKLASDLAHGLAWRLRVKFLGEMISPNFTGLKSREVSFSQTILARVSSAPRWTGKLRLGPSILDTSICADSYSLMRGPVILTWGVVWWLSESRLPQG